MAPADPMLGRTIAGKYRILEQLGSGGTASVYRAHHASMDKMIALKVQSVQYYPSSFQQRFEREAKMASRLDHPNSVTVLDSGRDGDFMYIAMEYVEGETLAAIIAREAPMDVVRIRDLMLQILGAVSAAHDVGIIHRDIKPANILVARRTNDEGMINDFVKVCDFGVAKFSQWNGEDPLTEAGALIGTPHYMSPEQAGGEEIDERTDVYSCGVMMYEMATGRLPFEATSVPSLLRMQMQNTVIAPSKHQPRVDRELERIIQSAMTKNVEQRTDSIRGLRRALKNLGNEDTVQEGATELDVKVPLRVRGFVIPEADTVKDEIDLDSIRKKK
jgi:eukaryotic-like serine/threonine-protein kinase